MDEHMRETRLRGSAQFPFERYEMRTAQQLIHVACHWQEDAELLSIKSGKVLLQIDGKQQTLMAGDVACINPHQLHGIRGLTADTAYDAYVFPLQHLLFANAECDQLQYTHQLAEGKIGFPLLLPSESEACRLVQDILRLDQERPPAHQLMIKANLLLLIGALAQDNAFIPLQPSRQSDLCRTILDYIHHHYMEKCSVADIATTVGLSPSYFSAFFTRHFAQRYSDYLLSYRIEQADAMLLRTEKPITEIALATGFGSSSHFIQCFRKQKGVTPLVYRSQKSLAVGAMKRA